MALAPLEVYCNDIQFERIEIQPLFFPPFPSPELCGNYFPNICFFPLLILISG